jgi:surface protein
MLVSYYLINHLGNWDVSNVTNMSDMFDMMKSFNLPLESWDESNVTNMNSIYFLIFYSSV